jgi:dihydropyrimidinase
MKTVVRGGTVVNASHSGPADVLVDGEEIVAVGRIGDVDADEIDASGCFVLPGMVDNHTHMSMPFQGTRSCDDYDTGTRAAAAGGVTCIVDFALQMHAGGLQSSLQEWQDRARGAAHVDYGFHMAITKADDDTLADMERIVELGVPSFKVFLAYPGELMIADDLFLNALERARDLGGFIMVHAENGMAIDHLVQRARREGRMDPINHALTRPEEMEAEATSRAVRLAEFAGAPVYIVHVSCKRAADEVEAGQSRGVRVAAETCAQYLFTSIDDLDRPNFEGARYVCSPPLRDRANQPHMWGFLDRGVLESISTDHCPFNSEQKAMGREDFSKIPNGLAGIQHRLVKMWEHGVREGRMTPERLVDVCSTAIARRFGLERKGAIAPGKDADLVIFDPEAEFRFSTDTSHMNVDYDIYDGDVVAGSVRTTLCRGTTVFDRGEILTQPGHGRFVERPPTTLAAPAAAPAAA